jgi:HlyD family secretion protein
VVARIDPRLYKTDVDKARANLTAAWANMKMAEATVREAKLQYERDRDLARKKVVAPAEVETRMATYQSAQAQVAARRASVEQAKAALSQARANLAYTTIVSPINGVVVSRSVDVGQTVAASLQAPTLFTIAEDLRKMEVHTSVAESDVGQLREAQVVRFTVDAYPNEEFSGVVKQVRFEATTVQNVVTYDAVISVNNANLKLRPGMTANVTFVVATRDDVLRVPTAALRFKLPGDAFATRRALVNRRVRSERLLWALRNGKPQSVKIRTGLSDGKYSEVVEGKLRPGEVVIVGIDKGPSAVSGSAKGKGGQRRHRPPRIL